MPVLQQLSAVECGAACLAMILSYHGRETGVADCREKCSPGRDGVTARAIAEAARGYGLRVKAYTLEPKNFPYLQLPTVVHWEFNHFVIVERWSARGVEIVDPASGRRTLSAAEFDAGFTGVALTFEPGAGFEKRGRRRGAFGRNYLRSILLLPGTRRTILQIILASLFLQLIGLALPLLTKLVVDRILPFHLTSLMTVLAVGVLLMVTAQSVLSFLRQSLLIYMRARLDAHLMRDFFEHLLALPFSFFQKRTSGDLLMRLSSNGFIREVLTNNTLSLFLDGSFILLYLLILLYVSPWFGAIAAGLGLLQILLVLGTRRRMTQLMQKELAARATEQGYLFEAVSGISLLKASGAEDRAFDYWSDLYQDQLNVSLERSRLSALIDTAMGMLRILSPLFLLWLGTTQVLEGRLSLGTMLALNTLAASFLAPITTLVMNAQQLLLAGAHLERVGDVLEAAPEQPPREDYVEFPLSGRIEVRNLSFQYGPSATPVLRDINVSIEPGQKIALVGSTASGKSTLAMLLLGLYQPTRGEITYDGVPLQKFNYRTLRRQTGVVLQEPFLFSGSILQNIAPKGSDLTLARVTEVATLAGLHEEVKQMPLGYETFISERGTTLSGGQRQRLALARALAHKPSILVLDEATSHLDVEKEAEVDENLSQFPCTRIVIAHRLSTVRNADQILVLDGGRLIEHGTHEELMAKAGRYCALVRRQSKGESGSPSAAREEAAGETVETAHLIN